MATDHDTLLTIIREVVREELAAQVAGRVLARVFSEPEPEIDPFVVQARHIKPVKRRMTLEQLFQIVKKYRDVLRAHDKVMVSDRPIDWKRRKIEAMRGEFEVVEEEFQTFWKQAGEIAIDRGDLWVLHGV